MPCEEKEVCSYVKENSGGVLLEGEREVEMSDFLRGVERGKTAVET